MSATRKRLVVLAEGAVMIALAFVLAQIKLFTLPYGGSVTLAMIPLVIMAYRHGIKWGGATAFIFGVLKLILGFENVMYCNTLIAQIGCVMLDYLVAYTVLGLAPLFGKIVGSKRVLGAVIGTVFAGLLRFVCSFFSGWLLWGSYAPEGQGPVLYSLIYNGSYMLPNIVIAAVLVGILAKTAPKVLFEEK